MALIRSHFSKILILAVILLLLLAGWSNLHTNSYEEEIIQRIPDSRILINTTTLWPSTSANITRKNSPSVCSDIVFKYNISLYSFSLGLSYWEQLTMATNSMCGLINFGGGWRARTVTPFTLNAEFYGLPTTVNFPSIVGTPPIKTKGKTRPISILYDMDSFNSDLLCQKYNLPPLASFEEFIYLANREITLLHFDFHGLPTKSYFKGKHYVDCTNNEQIKSTSNKLLSALNIESNKHEQPHFKLRMACCIDHLHITTPQEIAKYCGFHNRDSVTVVATVWRGYSDNPKKTFRPVVPVSPIFAHPSPGKDMYPLSKGVISNSSAFVRYLSGGSEFVSIHLRTAKVAMMDRHSRLFKKCFEKVQSLIVEIKKTYFNTKLHFHYFVDYGEYGSHSFEVSLGRKVSLRTLQENNIKPLHYDPKKYGGIPDQGFVALVEQLSLSQSKILILVGGGSFQDQMKTRFIQFGNGKRIYHVCRSDEALLEIAFERQ